MKSKPSQKEFKLIGKVVQTYQISGEIIAKIYVEPASIDLLIDSNEEVNLGDIISFQVVIDDKTIESVSHKTEIPF